MLLDHSLKKEGRELKICLPAVLCVCHTLPHAWSSIRTYAHGDGASQRPQPRDSRWWAKWAPSAQGTPSPSMSLNKWWRDWGPNGNLAAKTRPEHYISNPGGPAVPQAKGCLGSGSCVNSLRSSFRKDGEDCCSCPLEELCK